MICSRVKQNKQERQSLERINNDTPLYLQAINKLISSQSCMVHGMTEN